MLQTIDDYGPQREPDGTLGYKLVIVHVPRIADYYSERSDGFKASFQRFQEHIRGLAEEAHERFSTGVLEMEVDVDTALAGDIGKVIQSNHGNISEEDRRVHGLGTSVMHVVLTGMVFPECYRYTFSELAESGVSEIHMPLDGIYGFQRDGYPEASCEYPVVRSDPDCFEFSANPHLDVCRHQSFQEYVDIVQRRGSYSLFVPGRSAPFLQQGDCGASSLLAVFHRSWADMIRLFQS